MKLYIPIFIMIATLSSCNIYKTYKRPDVKTDDLYGKELQVIDTLSIGRMDWREVFTDPKLQALIDSGLVNNTDLRIARLKIDESKALLTSARLAYLPSVNLAPEGGLYSYKGEPLQKSYQLAATASWEIDIFGKLTNAKRKASANLEQSEAYRQAVRCGLIANIADSYYLLLTLDKQLDVARETETNWKDYIHVLEVLKKTGRADETAIRQSEANYLSVQSEVARLGQQVKEVENNLSALLGHAPSMIERGNLDTQSFPDTLLVGIPLDLLKYRPDVRMAEALLKGALYTTNQAYSAFYPTITLGGTAGWTNTNGGVISNPGAWLFQAVGGIVQPLFNRGANIANLKIAKAQQEEALLTFQQTLYDAGAEVNNAVTQWQSSRIQIDLSGKQVEALDIALENIRLRMKYGNLNYLEVLSARQMLLSAQMNYYSSCFEEIQSVITLFRALGGGSEYR